MPARARTSARRVVAARPPSPVLELPPVELPPPGGAEATAPKSLASRALVSVALLAGVVVLSALVVVALVGVNIAVLQATGRIHAALVIAAGVVVISLGKAVIAMFRSPPEPTDEVEIPAASEPDLYAMVKELADAAGTRPPDRIVMVADTNAYVREWGPMMGLVRGRRTMAIGAPLLDALDVSELKAVLAHELGHLSGGDTRLAPVAVRTEMALMRIVETLHGRQYLTRLFVTYWKFQHRVSASVRRGQELVADRAAVRVAGRQASADALRAMEVAANA